MSKNLVIVESPTKAKTISKILGEDFTVISSMGHIIDLPAKKLGVDIENKFKPEYVVIPIKKKLLAQLKKEAKLK
ncbi:MAG: toprim domain-containing protein, partial [Candidatus Omnitrophica bacterium]|nr:toprim domain-containing protein [Candidatus Omnitrophota bacterium]